ncbi:hypothetical protein ACFQ6S_07325 [Streptomyces sp. NPDC056479]|uniref:hypothetical protein n=1 Tax=Streptomyces sp. NPDC056479 TaxID=3345832 RepID=UPI0036B4CD4C
MRHVYHVPDDGGPEAGDEVVRAVRTAVLRGVTRAVQDLVGDGTRSSGEIVPLLRPPPRRWTGPGGGDPGDGPGEQRHVAVPSYQDQGRSVAVPVVPKPAGAPSGTASAPPAHPLVTAVNDVAAQVRRAEQAHSPVQPTVRPGTGILGRMWARAAAEDTGRLLRPTRADLEQVEGRLIRVVSAEALRIAGVLLDRNETVVRREAARYGEPNATVPGSPAVRLRAAATELAVLQRRILDRVRQTGNARMAAVPYAPQAGGPLDPSHFDDVMAGDNARADVEVQHELLPRLNTLRRIYGAEFPILLGRNLDYAQFAVMDPGRLAQAVGGTTSDVLRSIAQLRGRLTEESVWQLPPLLEAARHVLGVVPGTPAAEALDRYLAQMKRDEIIRQLLLTALGITLAIAATVATAGAAAPAAGAGAAALAGGLSLATAGVSVFGAVEQYESYSFGRAAAHASLDPMTALAREDPSIVWLTVSVLGAVADVGAAIVAVRNMARLAKLAVGAKEFAGLEQAARAQARVLAAEGRLAGTEQEFVDAVLKSAKRQIGGAAAKPSLRFGSYLFRPNPGGPRTLPEAVALAKSKGIRIEHDILIGLDSRIDINKEFAYYGNKVLRDQQVGWKHLTGKIGPPKPGVLPTYWTEEPIEEVSTMMAVRMHPDVLDSDEAIVAVLAHEMHEINYLRTELSGGTQISGRAYERLVDGNIGTLHREAWRIALALVDRMRATLP